MKLNTSKMIFTSMILLSTIVSFSLNNWFTMWIMMELALFMFIPLMSKNKINDQSMKYFIIQSLSSYILVFSILWNSINQMNLNTLLTLISLLLKVGMPPFHTWKPEIMNKLGWKECMLLTTLIKVPPMILINKLMKFKMMTLPMILSLLVGSMGGINQLNLKKMMAYSSIFNLTWMTSAFLMSKKVMLMFFVLYSTLNILTMVFFKKNNLNWVNQMTFMPLKMKLTLNLNLLSISGLPPLTGFYPKWVILNELMKTSIVLPSMMIVTSVLSIFMYTQVNTFTLSNLLIKKKSSKMNFFKTFSIFNLLVMPSLFILWTY